MATNSDVFGVERGSRPRCDGRASALLVARLSIGVIVGFFVALTLVLLGSSFLWILVGYVVAGAVSFLVFNLTSMRRTVAVAPGSALRFGDTDLRHINASNIRRDQTKTSAEQRSALEPVFKVGKDFPFQCCAEKWPDISAVSRPCVASVQPPLPQDQILPNWRQCRAHGSPGRDEPRVLFVADPMQQEAERLALTLNAHRLDVDICNDLGAVLASISEAPQRWSALIVDLDLVVRCSSLQSVVDDLFCFRQAVPDVPVVLLSADFSRDEMDLHRQSIADVSLRSPVMAWSFVEGLNIAKANNNEWLRRQISR